MQLKNNNCTAANFQMVIIIFNNLGSAWGKGRGSRLIGIDTCGLIAVGKNLCI